MTDRARSTDPLPPREGSIPGIPEGGRNLLYAQWNRDGSITVDFVGRPSVAVVAAEGDRYHRALAEIVRVATGYDWLEEDVVRLVKIARAALQEGSA